jgi:hypothetical protein
VGKQVRTAALVLTGILATTPLAHAQQTDLPRPTVQLVEEPQPPTVEEKLRKRLNDLEGRLERVEQKLDGLESLLRMIYAERIRRIERIAADEGLATAVKDIEERYGLRGVVDALAAEDPERLTALNRSLSKAAATTGERVFVRDRAVVTVLAAMASRPDFLKNSARTLVPSIAGRNIEAGRALAQALLETPQQGAHEAALWATIKLASAELAPTISGYARSLDVTNARLAGLAFAAASACGDTQSIERLAALVRAGSLPGPYAYQIANELRSSGTKTAFRVYLELLLDEQYAFAAAQAFARIEGFQRRVSWREVKGERQKLHDEFRTWLDGHWSSIEYDKLRGRFTLPK